MWALVVVGFLVLAPVAFADGTQDLTCGWRGGDPGKSCDDACSSSGRTCQQNRMRALTTWQDQASAMARSSPAAGGAAGSAFVPCSGWEVSTDVQGGAAGPTLAPVQARDQEITLTFQCATNQHTVVGFAQGNSHSDMNDIDCATYCAGGTIRWYELGSSKSTHGSYSTSTVFTQRRNGAVVTAYKNGVLFKTCSRSMTGTLLVDTSMYYSGRVGILSARLGNKPIVWTSRSGVQQHGSDGGLYKSGSSGWNSGAISSTTLPYTGSVPNTCFYNTQPSSSCSAAALYSDNARRLCCCTKSGEDPVAMCPVSPQLLHHYDFSNSSACPVKAQYLVIDGTTATGALHLREVVVANAFGVPYPILWGELSSTNADHHIAKCFDNNLTSTPCHSDTTTGWWARFDLGAPKCIGSVTLYNIATSASAGIVGASLSLHATSAAAGPTLWSVPIRSATLNGGHILEFHVGAYDAVEGASSAFVGTTRTATGVVLNGVDDYTELHLGGAIFGGAITIEAVVKWYAFKNNAPFLDCGNGVSDNMIAFNKGTTEQLGFSVRRGTSSKGLLSSSTSDLEVGVRFHIVAVVSGPENRLFINGIYKGQISNGHEPNSIARSDCFLGKSSDASTGFLSGEVSSIKIYSGNMDHERVLEVYRASFPILEHHWDFVNAKKDTIVDSVGGINATLMNGATRTAAGVVMSGDPGPAGQHVALDLGAVFIGGPITIEGVITWFKFNFHSRLFECGNGQEHDNIIVYNDYGSGTLRFSVRRGSEDQSALSESDYDLVAGEKYHIVTTVFGSTMLVYINGVKKGNRTEHGWEPKSMKRSQCFIGKSSWSGGAYLAGEVSFLKIYSGAMDQEQVSEAYNVYNATATTQSAPSVAPTALPTVPPTTTGPSPAPTLAPTSHPSIPTLSPTSAPTMEPTTARPSMSPTGAPTTQTPSTAPSSSPTQAPSNAPTSEPSTAPSAAPTSLPTASPSAAPTLSPSNTPSTSPSESPSASPSATPSAAPTAMPSAGPSTSPSSAPSVLPSAAPTTAVPSATPTQLPTAAPTAMPSSAPSTAPTWAPSLEPTNAPSAGPSFTPSTAPSSEPTRAPTSVPTVAPTAVPSTSPSRDPTWAPSSEPTNAPSAGPSFVPSTTPSYEPTRATTHVPTAAPTLRCSNAFALTTMFEEYDEEQPLMVGSTISIEWDYNVSCTTEFVTIDVCEVNARTSIRAACKLLVGSVADHHKNDGAATVELTESALANGAGFYQICIRDMDIPNMHTCSQTLPVAYVATEAPSAMPTRQPTSPTSAPVPITEAPTTHHPTPAPVTPPPTTNQPTVDQSMGTMKENNADDDGTTNVFMTIQLVLVGLVIIIITLVLFCCSGILLLCHYKNKGGNVEAKRRIELTDATRAPTVTEGTVPTDATIGASASAAASSPFSRGTPLCGDSNEWTPLSGDSTDCHVDDSPLVVIVRRREVQMKEELRVQHEASLAARQSEHDVELAAEMARRDAAATKLHAECEARVTRAARNEQQARDDAAAGKLGYDRRVAAAEAETATARYAAQRQVDEAEAETAATKQRMDHEVLCRAAAEAEMITARHAAQRQVAEAEAETAATKQRMDHEVLCRAAAEAETITARHVALRQVAEAELALAEAAEMAAVVDASIAHSSAAATTAKAKAARDIATLQQAQRAARAAQKQAEGALKALAPPHYWIVSARGSSPSQYSAYMKPICQKLLSETCMIHASHTFPCKPSMNCCSIKKAVVISCHRIQDLRRWREYAVKRDNIASEHHARSHAVAPLSASHPAGDLPLTMTKLKAGLMSTSTLRTDVNEMYLWHGYDVQHEAAIIGSSLDVRLANRGGLYGAGLYFAENSCKSNQYCQHHGDRGHQDSSKTYALVLCRVVLGDIYHTSVTCAGLTRPPIKPGHSRGGGTFDSIVACGGTQIHREFIVFENAQVYPEFTVHFTYQ